MGQTIACGACAGIEDARWNPFASDDPAAREEARKAAREALSEEERESADKALYAEFDGPNKGDPYTVGDILKRGGDPRWKHPGTVSKETKLRGCSL
mgnify:CR=1 FL=1|jgi:hypothetical protein